MGSWVMAVLRGQQSLTPTMPHLRVTRDAGRAATSLWGTLRETDDSLDSEQRRSAGKGLAWSLAAPAAPALTDTTCETVAIVSDVYK